MSLAQKLLQDKTITIAGTGNASSKALILQRLLRDLQEHGQSQEKLNIFYWAEEDDAMEKVSESLSFFHNLSIYQVPEPLSEDSNGLDRRAYEAKIVQLGANLVCNQGSHLIILNEEEFFTPIQAKADFIDKFLTLQVGTKIQFSQLFEKLLDCGYHPTELALVEPGTFLRRGGTLDIFPVNLGQPLRLELDDTQITDIYVFDMLTNKVKTELQQTDIFPLNVSKSACILDFLDQDALLVIDELEISGLGQTDQIQSHLEKNNIPVLRFTSFPDDERTVEMLRFSDVLRYSDPLDFTSSLKKKKEQGWKIIVATRRPQEVKSILENQKIVFVESGVENIEDLF